MPALRRRGGGQLVQVRLQEPGQARVVEVGACDARHPGPHRLLLPVRCPRWRLQDATAARDLRLSWTYTPAETLGWDGPSTGGWTVDAHHRAAVDVERPRPNVDPGPTGSEERLPGQEAEVHLAAPSRLAPSGRSRRPLAEREHRTLDRLAEGGNRCLGSVYYRASCPACGQPAVWHDQAVGQLPGLVVVRTTSEVVCCTTCDGTAP